MHDIDIDQRYFQNEITIKSASQINQSIIINKPTKQNSPKLAKPMQQHHAIKEDQGRQQLKKEGKNSQKKHEKERNKEERKERTKEKRKSLKKKRKRKKERMKQKKE